MNCSDCCHLLPARNEGYMANCARFPRWVAHQPSDTACGEFGEKPAPVVAPQAEKPKRKGKG